MAEGSRSSPRNNGRHPHQHHHRHHHHQEHTHRHQDVADQSPQSSASPSSQQPQKKICFICGTLTTHIINIYEPRIGPNIIDIINEKFKMRPLDDDKYLCYNCNNWLINWHSLQNRNNSTKSCHEQDQDDDDNDEDEEAVASAAAASGSRRKRLGSSSGVSKRKCIEINEKTELNCMQNSFENSPITKLNINSESDDDAIDNNIEVNYRDDDGNESTDNDSNYRANDNYSNVDCILTAAVHAVRTKLQKYLYNPNKRRISLSYGSNRHQLTLRNYYNFQQTNYDSVNEATSKSICRTSDWIMQQQNVFKSLSARKKKLMIKCKLCSKPILIQLLGRNVQRTRSKLIRRRLINLHTYKFCRKCKHLLHSYVCDNKQRHRSNSMEFAHKKRNLLLNDKRQKYTNEQANTVNENILGNLNIVNKLKLLGTSIFYENEECRRRQQQQQLQLQQQMHSQHYKYNEWNHLGRLPLNNKLNEIDTQQMHSNFIGSSPSMTTITTATTATTPSLKPVNLGNSRTTANEIVLTFNTVVTEVFPIELLNTIDAGCYNKNNTFQHNNDEQLQHQHQHRQQEGMIEQMNQQQEKQHQQYQMLQREKQNALASFLDITKNKVPKSLSITLA